MSSLFNRDFAIQVGTRRIATRKAGNNEQTKTTLRVTFEIKKSTNPEPNISIINIYNLSENNRKLLQQKDPIIVEAGYTKTLQQIFSGNITLINHVNENVDWITKIESGDGSDQYRNSRINISFKSKISLRSVLEEAAKNMSLDLGNSIDKITTGNFRKNFTEFTKGVVLNGKTVDILNKYLSTAGYQWSIQDKALQVLKPEETTEEQIVVLDSDSGLVGTPELGENGIIIAKSLLQGEIKPGRRIQIKSKSIDGIFKIETVNHVGDTWGNDWYSEIEAKPV